MPADFPAFCGTYLWPSWETSGHSSLSFKHYPLHGPCQLEHIVVCLRASPCGSSLPAAAAGGHTHRDLEQADDSPLLTILGLVCLCFPADRNFRRLPQNNSQQQAAFLALSTVACWGFLSPTPFCHIHPPLSFSTFAGSLGSFPSTTFLEHLPQESRETPIFSSSAHHHC